MLLSHLHYYFVPNMLMGRKEEYIVLKFKPYFTEIYY